MNRKIIKTQYMDIVFADKLIEIKKIDFDEYFPKDDHIHNTEGAVLIAKDINGNEIWLGEYENISTAEDIQDDMMEWLTSDCDLNPFEVVFDDESFKENILRQHKYILQFTRKLPWMIEWYGKYWEKEDEK